MKSHDKQETDAPLDFVIDPGSESPFFGYI